MANVSNSERIRRIQKKLEFFVKQTSTGTSEYLAAAALLNEYRIELSGVNGAQDVSRERLIEIDRSIDTVFANLQINYSNEALR